MRRLLCMVLSLVLSSALLLADDGQIDGLVTDHNGETLPGVSVTLHRRGLTRRANSNAQGGFAFSVPPGRYKLSAKLPGFKTAKLEVTVITGQTRTHVLVMEVGGTVESLEVRAAQR